MKYADIAGLTEKELAKRSKELLGQIFEARMKNSLGQLANPMSIRQMRRDFARLQTALNAKNAKDASASPVKAKAAGTKKVAKKAKA